MNLLNIKPFNMLIALILGIVFLGCEKGDSKDDLDNDPLLQTTYLTTGKSRYNPGETVNFQLTAESYTGLKVRYKHLHEIIHQHEISESTWQWTPPSADFKGYMTEVFMDGEMDEIIVETIAIDVSSDWTRFPRYGFLSEYGSDITPERMDETLDFMLRCRINGIQYYDWHYKHHDPLKMDGNQPAATWIDIANREISFNTVNTYISKSKERGIANMSYNLLFGAWEDYASDGVLRNWMLFKDASQTNIDYHPLPKPGFQSNLLLVNPANLAWQQYIFDKTEIIYEHLDFDGWHLDQLGNRGTLYDAGGNQVNLPQTYSSFLNNLKVRFPEKKMVLNSVNQFGQPEILSTPVDFAYSEIWNPNESFSDLSNIAFNNGSWASHQQNQVFAAYINYNHANSTGLFNTPAVLMANAVIFAIGSSHLELGEHMLAKEYFPNNNLQMRADLKESIIRYYDFLTAYQNILRDGGFFNQPTILSSDAQLPIKNWPPESGKISAIGKSIDNRQVIHFVNFVSSNHLLWRDTDATQSFPQTYNDITMRLTSAQTVERIWFASPDTDHGAAKEISFTQNGDQIIFTLPYLQYWSMIVIE